MSDPWLIAAALLSGATLVIHLTLGGRDVARPLLAAPLADEPKYTAYYCWHLVSISLAGMTLGLAAPIADPALWPVAAMWAAIAGGFALWSLALILWKRQAPLSLPQWALFLPIAACGALGLS